MFTESPTCPDCGAALRLDTKLEAGYYKYWWRCPNTGEGGEHYFATCTGKTPRDTEENYPPETPNPDTYARNPENIPRRKNPDRGPEITDRFRWSDAAEECPDCGEERLRIRATPAEWQASGSDSYAITTQARCACGHAGKEDTRMMDEKERTDEEWREEAEKAIDAHAA